MPLNQGWYDLNEARSYPVDDGAKLTDDAGVSLPSELIADLHLRFPATAGRRAFLSALTVTETLFTAVFLAADDAESTSGFVPLASLVLTKPLTTWRPYPLQSLYPGAGGWLVPGRGVADQTYQGRFATPAQSVLTPRAALAGPHLPVSSVARIGSATALTGLVSLLGGNDIEIVKACREIPLNNPPLGEACDETLTQVREVIVIRLVEEVGTPVRNVLDTYRGPCSGRPEAGTCGDPAPIEFISGVAPDCCGNITIELEGCMILSKLAQVVEYDEDGEPGEVSDACGVLLSCDLELEDACVNADKLPTEDGILPIELDDLCEEISITLTDEVEEELASESLDIDETSESAGASPDLPFCDDFEVVSGDYEVVSGSFSYVDDGGDQVYSTEDANGIALRNASVWDFEFDLPYKQVSATVKILNLTGVGTQHNAAVIAGYQETSPGSELFSYWAAELDWDGLAAGYKAFRIAYFNGVSWTTVLIQSTPTLALGNRYELSLAIYPHADENKAWLRAQVVGLDDSLNVTLGEVLITNFDDSVGRFGMGSNRSAARFYEFCVENTSEL